MPNVILKCPKCGLEMNPAPSDINTEEPLYYNCNRCKSQFNVIYFDNCPTCHINIGFVCSGIKNDLVEFGKQSLQFAFGSYSGLRKLGSIFIDAATGKVKECNGDGICPKCKKRYVRCPNCSNLFSIKLTANFTESFSCPHCKSEVSPGCSTRKGGGNKHSKAFYK